MVAQEAGFRFRFHTLRANLNPDGVAARNHPLHKPLAEAININARDDRAIQLELAEVQIQHVGEGCIAGAEIINGDRV